MTLVLVTAALIPKLFANELKEQHVFSIHLARSIIPCLVKPLSPKVGARLEFYITNSVLFLGSKSLTLTLIKH